MENVTCAAAILASEYTAGFLYQILLTAGIKVNLFNKVDIMKTDNY